MALHYYTSRTYQIKRTWQQFRNIFQLYTHQKRLESLKAWAKRKQLTGVYYHYNTLLIDVEMLLSSYEMRSPQLTFWTTVIYNISTLIRPETQYYKGYATMYSKRGRGT